MNGFVKVSVSAGGFGESEGKTDKEKPINQLVRVCVWCSGNNRSINTCVGIQGSRECVGVQECVCRSVECNAYGTSRDKYREKGRIRGVHVWV